MKRGRIRPCIELHFMDKAAQCWIDKTLDETLGSIIRRVKLTKSTHRTHQ